MDDEEVITEDIDAGAEEEEVGSLVEVDFQGISKERAATSFSVKFKQVSYSEREARCKHNHVVIDSTERVLECTDCGKSVDPIEYLIRFAEWDRRLDYRLHMIREFEEKQKREEERKRLKHVPDRDKGKALTLIQQEHRLGGHPRQNMWFTRNYINCYCGTTWYRDSNKNLEREIRVARGEVKNSPPPEEKERIDWRTFQHEHTGTGKNS